MTATRKVDLAVGGMTCASCAVHVERALNDLAGVEATVNFATETASVRCGPEVADADLLRAVEATGYEVNAHDHDHDIPARDLLPRLWDAGPAAVVVVALSMITRLQFDWWQWAAFALATPVATWAAWPFHRVALAQLRHAAAGMDTLISLGVLAAYGFSVWALVFGEAGEIGMEMRLDLTPQRAEGAHEIYLEVATAVTFFLLLGRHLEARAKRRAGAALRALLDLGAKDVAVLRDGREVRIPVDELRAGDRFVVRPGEKVATDGVVEEGTSAVDESLLTGESMPVDVGPGSTVTGATVNAGGRLVVRATRVGTDTKLAQIGRLVTAAQSGKAQAQRLADRVAGVFVPIVIAVAAATLGFWLGNDAPAEMAVAAAVAVLIVACPCALGLATPVALLVGTGRGAQLGILVKGPEALESARRIDTVVLDKTGTVTTGTMALVGHDGDEAALPLVAALEAASEHPVGRAIAGAVAAEQRSPVLDFAATPGLGVEGAVDGRRVVAGRPAFLAESGIAIPAALAAAVEAHQAAGRTAVAAAVDGEAVLVLAVADTVKVGAAEAVAGLRALGLQPILLTGDNERTARAVAAEIGIATVVAEVLPEGKVAAIRRLQGEGRTVAMVGDGVNDAAALAAADLGVAMGSGTDAAIEASDLTLVRDDPRLVVDAIRLSRRTVRTIAGNLFWAFAYNVAAVPLAAAGLVNPVIAGVAMAASSLFVVTNSLRLRRFE